MAAPYRTFEDTAWESTVPTSVPIDPSWGKNFSHASSIHIPLPPDHDAYLFVDRRITEHSKPAQIIAALQSDFVLGYITSCDGTKWVVVSEPLEDSQFGITVKTEAGKALIAGTGLFEDDGTWNIKFGHLYPGIRNARRVQVGGGVSGGTGQPTKGGGWVKFGF